MMADFACLLRRLFFASTAPEEKKLSPAAKYGLIFAFFLLTRSLTCWGFAHSGMQWLSGNTDPAGYIATAQYIAQNGHLSLDDDQHYRQFAGLPLLMVLLKPLFGDYAVTGYVIVLASGLGALALVQRLFDNLRLTLIFAVFLPYTIITTSTIYSEAPNIICLLLGFWAVRDYRHKPWLVCLGALIAGYCLVIRPPAVFLVLPVLPLLAWKLPGGSFGLGVLVAVLIMVPFSLYLTWNAVTIHELLPQRRLSLEDMKVFASRNPAHYLYGEYNFPFRGTIEGLTDPGEKLAKKFSVLECIATALLALAVLARTAWRDADPQRRVIATAFGLSLGIYLLFHVSLFPVISYKYLDRYVAGANLMIDWALFSQLPLRWGWIAAMALTGVLIASNAGGAPHVLSP
jgi:hypothetical protein